MAFEWKPSKGGLFLNKGKGPKFRGEINLDGKTIKLAGWAKETKNGDEWISLEVDTFVPRNQAPKAPAVPDDRDYDAEFGNAEVPF